MFKKNSMVVIDHALAAAKENYAKAVADFNSRAKQAYDALERKEYYFIEDREGSWAIVLADRLRESYFDGVGLGHLWLQPFC